jgi:hypothetical protein
LNFCPKIVVLGNKSKVVGKIVLRVTAIKRFELANEKLALMLNKLGVNSFQIECKKRK